MRGGVVEIDGELRPDQRLDPGLGRFLGKLQRAEQVVGVGDGNRRRLVRLGVLDQGLDGYGAFAQRIGAVNVGVDEADGFENRGIHATELSARFDAVEAVIGIVPGLRAGPPIWRSRRFAAVKI
jgi:hypothetical protein